MSLRTYLKSLGGRAGNKTRSRGRVNTKTNKRAASKAVRKAIAEEITQLVEQDFIDTLNHSSITYPDKENTMSPQINLDDLARQTFKMTKDEAHTAGVCIKCKVPPYIYSEAGVSEYRMSAIGETCFDSMFTESEKTCEEAHKENINEDSNS
jgi:hypothetical protein